MPCPCLKNNNFIQPKIQNHNSDIMTNNEICNIQFDYLLNSKNLLTNKIISKDFVNITENEAITVLGWINTMINLNDFCRYKIEHVINRINN